MTKESVSLCVFVWMGANVGLHVVVRRLNGVVMRGKEVVEQPVRLSDLTERLTKESVDFVRRNAKKKKPFLALVSFHKVHVPLSSREPFLGKSDHGLYGDNVEEVDWSVGQVLHQLKASGVENDTLVYFTSDHGPDTSEGFAGVRYGGWTGGLKGGKGNNYEGGIRVPTLAMWPGVIKQGSLYSKPTSSMDLFPTLAYVAHSKLPKNVVIDGKNFLPRISSKSSQLSEGSETGERFIFHYCGTAMAGVTYAPPDDDDEHIWKLHYQIPEWPTGKDHFTENAVRCFGDGIKVLKEPLLYDLSVDKSEQHPLISTDDVYTKVVSKINEAVVRHKSSVTLVDGQLTLEKQRPRLSRIHCCNPPWCSCRETTH